MDDLFKAGDEILEKINKAVNNQEYGDLGDEIRKVVSDTTRTVVRSGTSALSGFIDGLQHQAVPKRPPFFTKQVDRNDGIGKMVGGAIMTVAFAVACIIYVAANITVGIPIFFIGILILGLIGGIYLTATGKSTQKLISRFFAYGNIVGNRAYISIRELAAVAGRAEKEVVKDLKNMKMRGYLPTATFDRENTTLMLTSDVYQEYERSVRLKDEQNAAMAKQAAESKEKPDEKKHAMRDYYTIDESLPDDVKEILKDGNSYLNRIREYNDMIPEEEPMSDKLYTLEATVLSIFKKVKSQPNTAGDLRKFMNYYLPTTEKLLTSYIKLMKEDGSLENVRKSKLEIEDAMDVINDAFVKLLNQLFLDVAWDISSDISVMKTMMKQDALI